MVYFMFQRSPQAGLAHSVGYTWTHRGKVSSPMRWHPCSAACIEGEVASRGEKKYRDASASPCPSRSLRVSVSMTLP